MDETTLTRTLQELAANPPLHPSPSADLRRRAVRLRRSRRTGAAGLAAVVALAAFTMQAQRVGGPGILGHSTQPSWAKELTDPNNPNRATTGYVGLSRQSGGEYLVYWQGRHLCFQTTARPGISTDSECASIAPSKTATMTVANIGTDAVFVSVAPGVAYVDVRHPDGSDEGLNPNSADGFPYRVVVAQGQVLSLRAMDSNDKQIGRTLAGPAAPQLRQVLATFDCSDNTRTGFDVTLPDADTPKTCYGLASAAMTLVPKSAQAAYDSTQGWLIQMTLDDQDRDTFGQLTQRVTTQQQPKNQLAIVFDGKVVSAPVIQQAITGGQFQISGGSKGFTEDEARNLAADLSG
jgi:hypothetical protein